MMVLESSVGGVPHEMGEHAGAAPVQVPSDPHNLHKLIVREGFQKKTLMEFLLNFIKFLFWIANGIKLNEDF